MDSVVAMSPHFSGGTRTRRRMNVETKPRRDGRAAEWCALLMHPPLLVLSTFRLLNNLARCHLHQIPSFAGESPPRVQRTRPTTGSTLCSRETLPTVQSHRF